MSPLTVRCVPPLVIINVVLLRFCSLDSAVVGMAADTQVVVVVLGLIVIVQVAVMLVGK